MRFVFVTVIPFEVANLREAIAMAACLQDVDVDVSTVPTFWSVKGAHRVRWGTGDFPGIICKEFPL